MAKYPICHISINYLNFYLLNKQMKVNTNQKDYLPIFYLT